MERGREMEMERDNGRKQREVGELQREREEAWRQSEGEGTGRKSLFSPPSSPSLLLMTFSYHLSLLLSMAVLCQSQASVFPKM